MNKLVFTCLNLLILSPFGYSLSAAPVAYSGKVAINGLNVDGVVKMRFELHDGNGTDWWKNGQDSNASIDVPVDRGHYLVLLGGQGMNPLPDNLFLNHPELYLQVHFFRPDSGQWLHLQPDQRITSAPHALSASIAQFAVKAEEATRVGAGAITKSMLAGEVLADLNRTDTNSTINPGSITRALLAADVLADLNATISRSRLAADVLADLNGTISRSRLAADILSDLNHSIAADSVTLSMLSPQVRADLNSSVPAASVTAAKMHPDLVKYFLPEITSPPAGSTVLNGTGATIAAGATGKFLNYQWLRNGANLPGETNATLVIAEVNATVHDAN